MTDPETLANAISVRTARMLVRPVGPADRAEFRRVLAVSEAFWAPWSPLRPAGQTLDEVADERIERAVRCAQNGTEHRLVGVLDDGRIAGFFNLSQITRGVFQNAYAGWSVNVEVARQGFGAEGVAALLDLAFAAPPPGLGLHRVQANVIPANVASRRLAEKVGFRREGLALRYVKIAGEWRDHVMYAKLADEHAFCWLMPSDAAAAASPASPTSARRPVPA